MSVRRIVAEEQLEYLLQLLKAHIEEETTLDLSTTIDRYSTDTQIPSARAVYGLINTMIEDITQIEFLVVDALPATGEAGTIYLIRVSDDPETYEMHIFSDGEWRSVGSAEIDLSNYWSKDEIDFLDNEGIRAVFNSVFHSTPPVEPED